MPNAYIGPSIRTPFLHCPKCGKSLDAATGISMEEDKDPIPHVGTITLCLYCGSMLVFTENPLTPLGMSLAIVGPLEVEKIRKESSVIRRVHDSVIQLAKERKRNQG